MASRWRLNEPPNLFKLITGGDVQACSGNVFTIGDFVKVLARLDLVRISNDRLGRDEIEVGLAMESVTRLLTKKEIEVRIFATLLNHQNVDK